MSGLQYAKRLFQAVGFIGGIFLILEHYTAYGILELNDWIGHETVGFIIIIVFGLWILKDVRIKIKNRKENIEEVKEYLTEMGFYGRDRKK